MGIITMKSQDLSAINKWIGHFNPKNIEIEISTIKVFKTSFLLINLILIAIKIIIEKTKKISNPPNIAGHKISVKLLFQSKK
jgi:hypothetical protein